MSSARFATIAGTGRYVPERMMTNADVEALLGESVDAWLREKVGIHERHVMADTETTSDLAVNAARQALDRAGVKPEELDLIIVASDTPDYLSPGTASPVQAKLGARRAATFDVNCACASWVTALDVGTKAIVADSDYNNVLVVGAYGMTRYVDWKDKYTCTLFADGAGAVVLRASSEPGVLAARLSAHGEFHDALGIYTGGTARPATPEEVTARGKPRVQFVRKFPATFNSEHWPPLVEGALRKAGLGLDDVNLFLFTQLNLRTIEGMMGILKQPIEKAHWIMHKWGYTGSACIPMALDDAAEQGKLKRGDHVVLCASGGGIAMGAAVVRWTL
ncbi:3-oxoacyl-ACP synthase III family protein [Chondromyces apiculatus]|uniref:3-oxoacyl-[acyl-carrier-protein] synthase, KASIII n=1 Tax=Chondromyces apiculatus DSM 436 TaxID=1192034 RepID=A0A017SYA0_9BACT|nr:ketoacyl-ACP synthase III [Chondromyces apiculatus]EYF01555.1 3-oxoacyl-[acyl-carrier-protein] synthase, KASIII [Chondromyces apiculatus DSM 436]